MERETRPPPTASQHRCVPRLDLNSSERLFLALTDVEVTSLDGAPRVERRDFVALSLRHIVLAMPVDGDED